MNIELDRNLLDTRFVFRSPEVDSIIAVVTMAQVANDGTPIDPEDGEDMEFVGAASGLPQPGYYRILSGSAAAGYVVQPYTANWSDGL